MSITITHFTLTPIRVPLVHPLRQGNGTISELLILVLHLFSKNGLEGQSFIYGIGRYGHAVLIPYIEGELMPSILNQSFNFPSDLWSALWLPRRDKLNGGLSLYALALIDIACWDIAAKANGQSVHQFLGGSCREVSIYGSGGWLDMNDKELFYECNQFMEQGIFLYKIKIGGNRDEARIKFLRKEFGNKMQIAVDGNQRFKLDEAIEKAVILKNYDIAWFEDPLFSNSTCTLKKLFKKIKTPICVGENYPLEWQFEDVCQLDAADVLQPDVIRCGGITPFRKIIEIATQYDKKLITHLMPELSISLLSLCKTAIACELINMFPPELFTLPFPIAKGKMHVPTAPGVGVYISSSIIKQFAL